MPERRSDTSKFTTACIASVKRVQPTLHVPQIGPSITWNETDTPSTKSTQSNVIMDAMQITATSRRQFALETTSGQSRLCSKNRQRWNQKTPNSHNAKQKRRTPRRFL